MITLHASGPVFDLPDASPFVIKTLVHLKMSGQPFQCDTRPSGFFKAPKGKIPYIQDDGQVVCDSSFIRWHLEDKYKLDFDAGLTSEQRATGWAVEKMLEDNLYWIGAYWRWMDGPSRRTAADAMFAFAPTLLRKPLEWLFLRRIRGYLQAQGTGRHSEAEMMRLARRTLESVAALLGDKPYLMGERPTSVDGILYAMVAIALCAAFESPFKQAAQGHANLVAYEARMRARFFAEKGAPAQPSLFAQAGSGGADRVTA